MAIVYAATGALVVLNPAGGAIAITALIAVSFIALGLLRIIMALIIKGSPAWLWLFFGGVISTVFGIYIFQRGIQQPCRSGFIPTIIFQPR